MGNLRVGVNMEFVREGDKSFEWGVEKAAQIGYDFVAVSYTHLTLPTTPYV